MTGLLGRAVATVATGLVGAVAYDGVKKVVHRGSIREGAVIVTAAGLRGRRHLETGAEHVRLTAGDIAAEARARVGEEARPPGGAEAHDHEH